MKIDILKCECINVWTCAFKMTTLLVTFMVYSERKLLWKSSKFREIFFRISHPGEFFLQSIYHWNFAKMNFSKDSENDAKFQGIKYATILRKFIKMFASLSKFRINLFCGKKFTWRNAKNCEIFAKQYHISLKTHNKEIIQKG